MNQSDLANIRLLVKNNAFGVTFHAQQQMFNRNIEYDDIENVLTSSTNQLIESQSPSQTPGMEHKDERFLIFDPQYHKEIIVIGVVVFVTGRVPDIQIVTVEYADPQKWKKIPGANPSLVRIK